MSSTARRNVTRQYHKLGSLTWISDTLTNVQKWARMKSGISFHSRYVAFILKKMWLQGNQTGRIEKQGLLPYDYVHNL